MTGDLYPSRVIGHRGACALAPENTLASIRRAAADGARMVEVDVRMTGDGRAVAFHDDLLDRTTDGDGAIGAVPLSMLGALDAGRWFASQFAGEVVPTLEEVLETVAELDLHLNMEIKPDLDDAVGTARQILAAARACWPDDRPAPVVSSRSREVLAGARDQARRWPRALVAGALPGDWAEAAAILDLRAVHLGDQEVAEADVRKVTEGGHAVAVWTVNDVDRARELFRWGVSAVFSDDPGRLLRAL